MDHLQILRLARRFYPDPPGGSAGMAMLLLRCFVGVAFLFHGGGKTGELENFAREFDVPFALAAAAAYAQLLGAVILIVGIVTPMGSLLIASTMLVAVSKLIQRGEVFVNPSGHSWEAPAFYLVAAVVILLLGPGRYSLDGYLGGPQRAPQPSR
ncbi:MAG: DoxX family protein [Bryobacteraceae bacterium]|nr:DoxX family protein [Bryobacteraceae bacterium]